MWNICLHGPNEKDLRSFARKKTELEQFLSGPGEFSDILYLSNTSRIFMIFGGRLQIPAMGKNLGPETEFFFICQIDSHIFEVHHGELNEIINTSAHS